MEVANNRLDAEPIGLSRAFRDISQTPGLVRISSDESGVTLLVGLSCDRGSLLLRSWASCKGLCADDDSLDSGLIV